MIKISFEVTFQVKATPQPWESVFVVGDCDELGNWNPNNALTLQSGGTGANTRTPPNQASAGCGTSEGPLNKHDRGEVWTRTICLKGSSDYHYRYFIGKMFDSDHEETEKHVIVTEWETNLNPRKLSPKEFICNPELYDQGTVVFGNRNGQISISKGWLTGQSEIHIRFHGNPVHMWKLSHRKQTYRIKCTPVDHRYRDLLDDEDEDGAYLPNVGPGSHSTGMLVSVLRENESDATPQDQHGHVYLHNDYMTFKMQSFELESLGFQFDFYVEVSPGQAATDLRHVGYCHLLPMAVNQTKIVKKIPIMGLKHKPIGEVSVDFLIVKPLREPMCMDVSYQSYWSRDCSPVDVGHRGMGSSYKHKKQGTVRENTIASLDTAGKHGVDFVEFDVHLSKDLIPIIYHDYEVCITSRKKKRGEMELIALPVKELKLSELQSMKLKDTSQHPASGIDLIDEEDLDPIDLQPFPTLTQCLQTISPDVGFNIEVKYPMKLKSGRWEQENYFDTNLFVDKILSVVMAGSKSRKVIFSSFDPDTCILLQLKQNRYPVLFLTMGVNTVYEPYSDVRSVTIDTAILFALSANLLGIDVFTECLLRDMSYIEKTKEAQLVLFCWGEDNNDSDTIKTLKEQGVNGVIYDKWMVQDGNKSETWEVSSEFSPLKNVQFKEKTCMSP